jgi:hypothetical protein
LIGSADGLQGKPYLRAAIPIKLSAYFNSSHIPKGYKPLAGGRAQRTPPENKAFHDVTY